MDADEVLARQLQAEEDRALAGELQSQTSNGTGAFGARVEAAFHNSLQYDDPIKQALALSVIPADRLVAAADGAAAVSRAMGEQPPLAQEDALAKELLAWFKSDFFAWVNNPACGACGSERTDSVGVSPPSAVQRAGSANRTELYVCRSCGADVSFPRYNDAAVLLETRRGRCGEWANCFTLCCRAMGLEARIVQDWTDHVWTEYHSHALRRWVHLDPCETAYDTPLLYEVGWGKQLSYVVAFSAQGVADVTRRYSRDWAALRWRRTLIPEASLANLCTSLTGRARAHLGTEERSKLAARDRAEQQELQHSPTAADALTLPGRQTGSLEWRAGRGELGAAAVAAATALVPAPETTRYARALDAHLASSQPPRLCGGMVRASGENAPSETAVKAFDGHISTKWLYFGAGNGKESWIEYALPVTSSPVRIGSYCITSANDFPERDPCDFSLEGIPASMQQSSGSGIAGKAGAGEAWQVLDRRRGITFSGRHQRLHFQVAEAVPCRRHRLRIMRLRDPRANCIQLARLDLFLDPSSAPASLPARVEALNDRTSQLSINGTATHSKASSSTSSTAGPRVAASAPGSKVSSVIAAKPSLQLPEEDSNGSSAAASRQHPGYDPKKVFQQRVALAFTRLMAKGGLTANEAAAQALTDVMGTST